MAPSFSLIVHINGNENGSSIVVFPLLYIPSVESHISCRSKIEAQATHRVMLSSILSPGFAALLLASSLTDAALTPVSNFGSNPTGLQMNIYVPSGLATSPAVILAVSPTTMKSHSLT